MNFIKDEFDAITAKQICEVIQKNIGSGNNKSDPYFDTAAVELFVGVLLLTKAIQAKIDRGEVQMNSGEDFVSDLLTAQIILNQPDFAALMEKIDKSKKFDSWTMGPFKQIISLKSSEKTGSIVISIVQKYFNLFMCKRYLPAFCGNTTIPLDLEGKILLICGLDRNTRDVVSPLMATVIHMIVTRNVSKIEPRKDPLIVMLDEFPTLYLPQLPRWLNENREQGFCGILGAQNRAQLVDAYGEQMAKIVFAGTATKFLFDPQDEGSASDFSKYLGNKEVVYETYSHSFQGGKKTGRTVSEQRSNKALFDPSDFLQLPRGNCIFINPMYGDRKKGSVPLRKEIKVSKKEILAVEKSIDRWKDVLKENEEEAKEQNVAEIDLQVRQNDIEIFLDSIVNEKEDVYF